MAKSTKKRDRAPSSPQPFKSRSGQQQKDKRGGKSRTDTKQSRAITLLRSAKGATIDALMKTTGWKQHSVRGFLAGVVRKRLKLDLASDVVDGRRVYRIIGGGARAASADWPDQ